MKNLIIVLCILFCCNLNINAQNLIPNPSFEQHHNCLFAINQYNILDSCLINWTDPIDNFTQYYNPCNLDSNYRAPLNGSGSQVAKDGNTYVGISMTTKNSLDTTDYHQYIQTKLTQPLITKKKYSFKMYVNLADSMEFDGSGGQTMIFSCNNIGVFFSTWKAFFDHTSSISKPIYAKPLLLFTQVIKDTANWAELSQTFIADSAYEYITIGNFMHDYQCEIDTVSRPHIYATGVLGAAVFFIDDVSLIEDTSNGITNLPIENSFVAYPNPANSNLTISQIDNLNRIEVYDLVGLLKLSVILSDSKRTQSINVESLPKGIYFLKATDEKCFSQVVKFVKE